MTVPFVAGTGAGSGRAGARPSRARVEARSQQVATLPCWLEGGCPSQGAAKMAAPHVVRIRVISPNRGNDRGNVVADTE